MFGLTEEFVTGFQYGLGAATALALAYCCFTAGRLTGLALRHWFRTHEAKAEGAE